MKTGEKFQAVVEKCVFGGEGLLRLENNLVVLVKDALPGEEIIGEITAEKKNFVRGRVLKRLSDSIGRTVPECPNCGECPGCSYMHCTMEEELRIKQQQFLDFAAGFGAEILPPVAPNAEKNYRNKLVLHVHKASGETFLGYFKEDNVTVADTPQCLLAMDSINRKLSGLRADKSFRHSLREGMDVTFRNNPNGGVLVWRNQAPGNLSWLRENTMYGEISAPPSGFFQVNSESMNLLLGLVKDEIAAFMPEHFIDLYCGCGLFAGLAASMGIKKVTGVELDESAAAAANFNMKRFPGVEGNILSGDAAKGFAGIARSGSGERRLLLVDPPRTGLGKGVIPLLRQSGAKEIIYISCHPATWKGDVLSLQEAGFDLQKCSMLNMFPRTEHFEIFSVLHRK